MATATLKLVEPSDPKPNTVSRTKPKRRVRDLGHVLRTMGALSNDKLTLAKRAARQSGVEIGRYLDRNGLVSPARLLLARSLTTGLQRVDLKQNPPDARLIDRVGASRCLRYGVLPWRDVGGATLIAVSDPSDIVSVDLGTERVIPVLAEEDAIRRAILTARGRQLSRRAEVRTDEDFSCRNWPIAEVRRVSALILLASAIWALIAPLGIVTVMLAWTILTMVTLLALKLAASLMYLARRPKRIVADDQAHSPGRRPHVSIIVPLFHETAIAEHLVRRLCRLQYPRELLEVWLVLEAEDKETSSSLARAQLPPWFHVIEVPKGRIKTKPRALNFALDFCNGDIIGVYDAEDAPEPDQIDKIVDHFQNSGPNVACLQGRLDYYNPRLNWLSRCFTIEYATWFRIVLPDLQCMGLPVPLGGTTVFFRRSALEALGAWDAHNVTEDADLGMRLARKGFRTELADTVTYEEANARLWPWIKQRSRWLKGIAVTYCVHMRAPGRLLNDLGAWKFLGFQVILLGALSQFALAPLLWTFWPAFFGLWHPFQGIIGPAAITAIAGLFILSEAVSMCINIIAVADRRKWRLAFWVPTMIAYFPFATLAAFKGLWELRSRPFYWDKTEHGLTNVR